ncbi:MAG TPA: hypothetical protein VGY31_13020 [Terriglobia bacterium]|nr:hypothetical protein [Terriglobia bacterium]
MRKIRTPLVFTVVCWMTALMITASPLAFGQDQSSAPPPAGQTSQDSGGWHRFSGPPPAHYYYSSPSENQTDAPPQSSESELGQTIPARLVMKQGTFVTVRVDQMLSSDKNQAGDQFSATLEKPIVVDGVVVAASGETVGGQVIEAQKAGRIKGVSRLAVELTSLTLVDGEPVSIHTSFDGQVGPTSKGRDAGAVAGTTALGAAVGAAADWGRGAAIGAGAGAVAGTLGVLLTRGRPTMIYPESELTFRLETSVAISTARAPQAFRYVRPADYQTASAQPPARPSLTCGPNGCPPPPPPYYYPPLYYGFYGPPLYPAYFGPTFFFGRGFYYRHWR